MASLTKTNRQTPLTTGTLGVSRVSFVGEVGPCHRIVLRLPGKSTPKGKARDFELVMSDQEARALRIRLDSVLADAEQTERDFHLTRDRHV